MDVVEEGVEARGDVEDESEAEPPEDDVEAGGVVVDVVVDVAAGIIAGV